MTPYDNPESLLRAFPHVRGRSGGGTAGLLAGPPSEQTMQESTTTMARQTLDAESRHAVQPPLENGSDALRCPVDRVGAV